MRHFLKVFLVFSFFEPWVFYKRFLIEKNSVKCANIKCIHVLLHFSVRYRIAGLHIKYVSIKLVFDKLYDSWIILQFHLSVCLQNWIILQFYLSVFLQSWIILQFHLSVCLQSWIILQFHLSVCLRNWIILQFHLSVCLQSLIILQFHLSVCLQNWIILQFYLSVCLQSWISFRFVCQLRKPLWSDLPLRPQFHFQSSWPRGTFGATVEPNRPIDTSNMLSSFRTYVILIANVIQVVAIEQVSS